MSINVGEPTTLEAQFRVGGVLTTPTSTTITVLPPGGVVQTVTPVAAGTGIVQGIYTPAVEGIHYVRFQGTGAAAGIHEYPIYVHPRMVPAPV